MLVIPAINADNFEEIKKRIKLIEPFVDWVHIDAADGTFTKNTIWHNSRDLLDIETNLNIEVHLMMSNVEKRIDDWLLPNIKRIIFHLDGSVVPDFVIKKIKDAGKQAGIAISPDISWTKALHYKGAADIFLVLGVYPGLSGRKIQESCFEKIKEIRKFCPSCIIEVDGGMNKETVKKAVKAGANIIAAGSAIFKEKNIEKAIKELC